MNFQVTPSGPLIQTIAPLQPLGFKLFQVRLTVRPDSSVIVVSFEGSEEEKV